MASQQAEREMSLKRVYIKDLSFESPKSPEIFTSDLNAEVLIDVQARSRGIDAETVEVTLTLTIRLGEAEDTVFLVELAQAGLFTIRGFTPDERLTLFATECPRVLHSYARVAVADLVSKGGFPELLLQPVDFHALHAESMQAQSGPAG